MFSTPSNFVFHWYVLPLWVRWVTGIRLPFVPLRTTFNCRFVSLIIGSVTEKPYALPSDSSWLMFQGATEPVRAHACIAPSAMLRLLSGITRSGSTSSLYPSPVQVEQAP